MAMQNLKSAAGYIPAGKEPLGQIDVEPCESIMSRGLRILAVAVLVVAWSASGAHAQDIPLGMIIGDIKCAADPAQSYALYVPSTYLPDRPSSLLIAFHPGARGRAMVEKYAAAAQSLSRPASAARALFNGAPNIERADKLVQLIARQKGLSHPVIDANVTLVDELLEKNRRKAVL